MIDRFVVIRNGSVFQYCENRKKARRVVRKERLLCKLFRLPVDLEIIKEKELRKH